MTDYDVIVIGAGNVGLTAAARPPRPSALLPCSTPTGRTRSG